MLEVVSPHAYRLDTPSGIHNVFHTALLRPTASDPFPSQASNDTQPGPVIIGGEEEFEVETILDERIVRRGRGTQLQYLVKWKDWHTPLWNEAAALEDCLALDSYEQKKQGQDPTRRPISKAARRERRLEQEARERREEAAPAHRKRGRPRKTQKN